MTDYKYGIGPMSKNVVDSCIEFVNKNNKKLILIPSRRQIDYDSGYVNFWTTETFSKYVKNSTDNILLKRDHGGPSQGAILDDGLISLSNDCMYMDAIHIDPWKEAKAFIDGCVNTVKLIKYCYKLNKSLLYEVGTEEAIYKYESGQLNELLSYLKTHLSGEEFNNIKFAVIQSGTSLKETHNTGSYDSRRLIEMISVCSSFGLISKEHNGDYLPVNLIREKFMNGLDSINIAPEFGRIETMTYIDQIKNTALFDIFFDICYKSNKWKKWVNADFNPLTRKLELIQICGHYVLSYPEFNTSIKQKLRIDIDQLIKYNITEKLNELYGKSKNNIL